MAPYLIHAIQEDPVCSERVITNHQQLNIVKVYTRSIVIRGWDLLLLSHEYLLRKLAIYKPEAITIEKEQKQVFVTFRTRKDADRLLAAATFHNVFDEKHVRMAYASNYVSVLQHGDASKSGIYYLKASRLNKTFVKFAAREIGSHLITRHYDDIGRQLSEEEQIVAQSYGGIWLGGLQLEEPYKPKNTSRLSNRVLKIIFDELKEQNYQARLQELNEAAVIQGACLPLFNVSALNDLAHAWLKEECMDQQLAESTQELVCYKFCHSFDQYTNVPIYEVYHQELKTKLFNLLECIAQTELHQ